MRTALGLWAYGGRPNDPSFDNLPAFIAALAAVSSVGGGTIFIPAGVWYLSAAPSLETNTIVQGEGWGSVLRLQSGGATSNILRMANASVENVRIRSLRIQSVDVGSNFATGVAVAIRGTGHRVEDCWVSDATYANLALLGAQDCVVTDCLFTDVNGRLDPTIGVDLTMQQSAGVPCVRNTIRGCRSLSANKLAGIQLLVNTADEISDCDITENVVVGSQTQPNAHGIVQYASSGATGKFSRNRIHRNRVFSVSVNGIYLLGASANDQHEDCEITENVIVDASAGNPDGTILNAGIACVGMVRGKIVGNTVIGVTNAGSASGIKVSDSRDVEEHGNTIVSGSAMYAGIATDDNTSHCDLGPSRALATDSASTTGMSIQGDDHRIVHSHARGWGVNIHLFNAARPVLQENVTEASQNGGAGLSLSANCTDARIVGHTDIPGSPGYGLWDLSSASRVESQPIIRTSVCTGAYTPIWPESLVPCDTTGVAFSVTLPSHDTALHGTPSPGSEIVIVLVAGTNVLTISPETGTINGVASLALNIPGTSLRCVFDGVNYMAF